MASAAKFLLQFFLLNKNMAVGDARKMRRCFIPEICIKKCFFIKVESVLSRTHNLKREPLKFEHLPMLLTSNWTF